MINYLQLAAGVVVIGEKENTGDINTTIFNSALRANVGLGYIYDTIGFFELSGKCLSRRGQPVRYPTPVKISPRPKG